jgi:AmmeMemoRadiSam system protein A
MSPEDSKRLLELARSTMACQLSGERLPPVSGRTLPSEPYGGLFVSLHRGKQLRGCIGTFALRGSLEECVQSVSVGVLGDSRFVDAPVTAQELPQLEVEISLLSKPIPTDDPLSLEPGKHGIIVESRGRSGCFLPQVGSQFGWSAERLLSECCAQKAHLPADAWKDPQTTVSLFTAEVICDRAG